MGIESGARTCRYDVVLGLVGALLVVLGLAAIFVLLGPRQAVCSSITCTVPSLLSFLSFLVGALLVIISVVQWGLSGRRNPGVRLVIVGFGVIAFSLTIFFEIGLVTSWCPPEAIGCPLPAPWLDSPLAWFGFILVGIGGLWAIASAIRTSVHNRRNRRPGAFAGSGP
jgi:uncharacterized membrane protein YuzA (DUF378 family)